MLRERLARAYLIASVVFAILALAYVILGLKSILYKSPTCSICLILAAAIFAITSGECYRRYSRLTRYIRYQPED